MKLKQFILALAVLMSMAVCCMVLVSCGDEDDEIAGDPTNNGNGGSGGSAPKEVVAVDLGLPSGTLWANMNVGGDYGLHFSWGETVKRVAHKMWEGYKWCNGTETTLTKYCNNSSYGYNGFTDNLTELEPEDDAAYVCWGKEWRMPSKEQFEELLNSNYTTIERFGDFFDPSGVNLKVISKTNGNFITFFAAGYWLDVSLSCEFLWGAYWSRTLCKDAPEKAFAMVFSPEGTDASKYYPGACSRDRASSVRPVRNQ